MANENIDYSAPESAQSSAGPFLAKVVSHLVPSYMGVLEVELLRPVGNDKTSGQLHQVKMMSPFWGSTSVDYTSESANDYNNTQKSYGMWFVPPDPGTTVVVIFIDGDPKRGYWIGCIPDENMNFMVPGIAATEQVVEGGGRLPVAEYNKKANPQIPDATKIKKPKHPLATVLQTQGLDKDDIRGITTSSARRELPSSVFGISTPGPIDKAPGAKTGKVGKADSAIETFVSRLGGTTFVMDDGDDKFLRKTKANLGPPEYVSVEQGETGGKKDIPHNELFRIRTRTGHQILLHNSEDLIYIGNARGTTWIELTSNGKIDIYAQDSVSVHTDQDLNFTATRDINLTAGQNINFNAGGTLNQQSTGQFNIRAGAAGKIYAAGNVEILAKNTYIDGGEIHLNSGKATAAAYAGKAARSPKAEPWKAHENLDPLAHVPAKTRAVVPPANVPAEATPAKWKNYTTATDTFKQEKPANGK
jgi:hypothetical protein